MHYKFKSKPFAHQNKALEMSWDKEVFAYFMEMGTGKSKVLIDNIAMLYNSGRINGALIVAPKGVYKTWFDNEIPNHMPDYIEKKVSLWRTDPNAKDLQPMFKPGAELHILIMNVEAFSTKKGLQFAHRFLSCHDALMGVDESTTIKNPTAKRTKSILSLRSLTKYRRILTGSPVTKSPLDLFSQCNFLDPWLLDQSSYYSFRTRYAICRKIQVHGRQVEIVVLNGKMVTSATVITQLMRLHQITCGHFTSDDGTIQEIKNNRIPQLMDILEEVEGKAVIWAHYRHDIEKLVEAISKKYGANSVVTYYGDTTTDERAAAIKKIQDKESPVRFIVGTPQTGGYGITLTGASTMIYYSNGYDLEKRQQSEARIDRIGQEKPMTYIDIMAEDTVDMKIVKSLRQKVNIATEIMGEELKDWI
jgi:SNF2 family DNA or RNA helicase